MDAAVELASHGHKVHVFTAHHDKNRCFEETVAGKSMPLSVCMCVCHDHIYVFIMKLHSIGL